jgi:hypothetical protein
MFKKYFTAPAAAASPAGGLLSDDLDYETRFILGQGSMLEQGLGMTSPAEKSAKQILAG